MFRTYTGYEEVMVPVCLTGFWVPPVYFICGSGLLQGFRLGAKGCMPGLSNSNMKSSDVGIEPKG